MTPTVAGAGFSGAVVDRERAEAGRRVPVLESRSQSVGNRDTRRQPATGVIVCTYGPHVFHTGCDGVWRQVIRFDPTKHFANAPYLTPPCRAKSSARRNDRGPSGA